MNNQEQFNGYLIAIRKAWGLKTSTYEKICRLIGNAITFSVLPNIDQEQASVAIEAIWLEWTTYRASYFFFKSPEEIFTSISRFPLGEHYYVKVYGKDILIEKKFNTVKEAESYLATEVSKLESLGKKIINK